MRTHDKARLRYTDSKRRLQRGESTGRGVSTRTARGGYSDMDTNWHDYNYSDSCWFPSCEVLTPRTTRGSES